MLNAPNGPPPNNASQHGSVKATPRRLKAALFTGKHTQQPQSVLRPAIPSRCHVVAVFSNNSFLPSIGTNPQKKVRRLMNLTESPPQRPPTNPGPYRIHGMVSISVRANCLPCHPPPGRSTLITCLALHVFVLRLVQRKQNTASRYSNSPPIKSELLTQNIRQ